MKSSENKPLVSILIPVYNVEQYLDECLNSVITQSYDNLQIILCNDGSTDNSPSICNDYQRIDSRITVFTQKNSGLSIARNNLLKHAKGDYVYFLDSDDYISHNAIEQLLYTAQETKSDVVMFLCKEINQCGEIIATRQYYQKKEYYEQSINGRIFFELLCKNKDFKTCVSFLFIERDLLLKSKLDFYPHILHEDDLFTFLLLQYAESVTYLEQKLYYRRTRANSIMTSEISSEHINGKCTVICEIIDFCHRFNLFKQSGCYISHVNKRINLFERSYIKLNAEDRIGCKDHVRKMIYKINSISDISTFIIPSCSTTKTILYGAGEACGYLFKIIDKFKTKEIYEIWDINAETIGHVYGHKVIKPRFYQENKDTLVVVCIYNEEVKVKIIEQFIYYGYNNIIDFLKYTTLYRIFRECL